MYKKIFVFLFCLTSSIVNAQSQSNFRHVQKSVICGPVSEIFKMVSGNDIKENPIWIGKDEREKSNYIIFVNSKTGAFTLVQADQEIGCILGLGYSSKKLENPT